jgi:hypothetical protein
MAASLQLDRDFDDTRVAMIVRYGITLAVIEAVFVIIVSVITKSLSGFVEHLLTGIAVFIGAMIVIFFPGTRTRPRTIEGIAGAAGIGLLAAWVFVPIDAFLLQPFHVYTNRWHQIGGWSIWWYIPVWWMVGTFAPWMGAWILSNQANRTGRASVPIAIVTLCITTAVVGSIATLLGFPGAGWHVPTFAVCLLPGLVLANAASALGRRQG